MRQPWTKPQHCRHNWVCGVFGRVDIVRVCVLASSSSGNATFLQAGRTRILVDAGLSRREISSRLAAIGEDVRDLDAILITHEHTDHVSGLVAMSRADRERRASIPVYMTHLTAPAISWNDYTPALECFQAGSSFSIGDIDVLSFTIPHDAADPVGFCFRAEGIRVGLATDLGYLPDSIRVHLRGADLVILESNHDVEMLKVGPYPWSVKQRVLGRNGHLSNDVACDFIRDGLDTSTSTLVLGHLSEQNNHPEIVRISASQALEGRRLFTRLVVAEPGKQTEVFAY
ncbi:MAG TPA: MBL fold metallo-hydrolase [Bryobacteraceae bacterium]|nr:MBL fold metallo-hydrolase [Bryobacteraceae bacterium]